jgi:hypothetical protein
VDHADVVEAGEGTLTLVYAEHDDALVLAHACGPALSTACS